MTENKRYKQTCVCGDYGLLDFEKPDGEQWIDLHPMGENGTKNVQICIDIMNELVDEIQFLKFIRLDGKPYSRRQLEKENKELRKRMNRLYHYFKDYLSDEMGGNQFSEMWDMVEESEEWEF